MDWRLGIDNIDDDDDDDGEQCSKRNRANSSEPRALIRDEERKERLQIEAAARVEAAAHNRRAEERQIRSLSFTTKRLENSLVNVAHTA